MVATPETISINVIGWHILHIKNQIDNNLQYVHTSKTLGALKNHRVNVFH